MLYSGDEIGQVNDYTYKNDPEKQVDSRYIHRGKFDWKLAGGRKRKGTVQKNCLMELENLDPSEVRKKYLTHRQNVWTLDTWENGILGVVRELEGEQMTALLISQKRTGQPGSKKRESIWIYIPVKSQPSGNKMEGHSFVLAKKC